MSAWDEARAARRERRKQQGWRMFALVCAFDALVLLLLVTQLGLIAAGVYVLAVAATAVTMNVGRK